MSVSAFVLLGAVFLTSGLNFAQAPSAAAPSPSPLAACAQPNRQAMITYAESPDYPDGAQISAAVKIVVILNTDAQVIKYMIVAPSEDPRIDAAAVRAALRSTYAPALVNCSSIGGTYMFVAEFERVGGGGGGSPYAKGPTFGCAEKDGDPTLLHAGIVHWPVDSRPAKHVGAIIKMTVGADGSIRSASINQSTGSDAFDRAAINAAKASQFAPACSNYLPIASTFGYEVDFDPSAASPSPSPTR